MEPIQPVVTVVHLPAGVAGPDPMQFDVRCFLLPHATGLVLVDTGPPQTPAAVGAALLECGASWADVTDVILTHAHEDHVGGLPQVRSLAPRAVVSGGAREAFDGPTRALADGDTVRGIRVLETPGHTPGHLSLFVDDLGTLLIGDLAGTEDGRVVRAPAQFTSDAAEAEGSLRRLATLGPARVVFSHGHGHEIENPLHALRALVL